MSRDFCFANISVGFADFLLPISFDSFATIYAISPMIKHMQHEIYGSTCIFCMTFFINRSDLDTIIIGSI